MKRLIPYNISPSTHVLFCLHVTCFNSIKWSIWIFVVCTLLCHQEWKSPTSYMSPARAESLAIKRTSPVCLHHCCFWIPSAGYPSCNPWIEPFWSRWKLHLKTKTQHYINYKITQMRWNTRFMLCAQHIYTFRKGTSMLLELAHGPLSHQQCGGAGGRICPLDYMNQ